MYQWNIGGVFFYNLANFLQRTIKLVNLNVQAIDVDSYKLLSWSWATARKQNSEMCLAQVLPRKLIRLH